MKSPEFENLLAAANEHHRCGRLAQSEAAFQGALALSPGHPAILQNLGVLAARQGNRVAAIERLNAAIAAEPQYASAHYNLAVLLWSCERLPQSISAFERVCALEPDHYGAHRALGFLWLAVGDRDRSLDHFARTYELRRGEDRLGLAEATLAIVTREKLAHDAEQFRYLALKRRGGSRFEALARVYQQAAQQSSAEAEPISETMRLLLGEGYNSAISIAEAPALEGPAVAERGDRDQITADYRRGIGGVAIVDNLLTPAAMTSLRRFLLQSTIWHDFSHIGGFVAAYLEDGLACPLLLQIADELRRELPDLVREHPLSQAWAFKSLSSQGAIAAHADDAAISVNFWVTPDEANLDSSAGGLLVCHTPPPVDWELRGYNEDMTSIQSFLDLHADQSVIASYRENRAVIFDSRLFHRSDAPKFAPGYENHRINVTLLFGRRSSGA
jgi:tetratricopeptide (TPR) repeat protein